MKHLAMTFVIAHPGVTSALIGPRTMEQLDDLLAGIDVTLTDDILDAIDEIVPPGTDVGAPTNRPTCPRPFSAPPSAVGPPPNALPLTATSYLAPGLRSSSAPAGEPASGRRRSNAR